MAYKILVVKAEQEFVSTLNTLITSYNNDLSFSFVAGRKEAMLELQKGMYDRIVTALKIPRISDGYLFLSYIVKTLTCPQIIVVVDEKNDEVMRSINVLGIKKLFSASNVKGVLQAILEDSGLIDVQTKSELKDLDVAHLSVDRIKNSLNWVMGPVGNMIYCDAAASLKNQNDLSTLINLISGEIGEEKKIALFRDHLRMK
ncbi:MAG: hypothetical protein KJ630_14990 [Proteobacteria bacterium]|nr:hypothetical protein [Pseudomonadota bacterium]